MITLSNAVVRLILIIWLLTLGRSFIIMLGGNKLFDKALKGGNSAFFPIINLFVMLDIGNVSTFLGILFFIPFVNLIILALMSYKVGKAFEMSSGFIMGLIFLPFIFYPLMFRGNLKYKYRDENYFLALDSARADSINLMSEDEIKDMNNSEDFKDNNDIDSIFKTQIEMQEAAPTYRANRIDSDTLNKMDDLPYDDNLFSPIERIEVTPYKETETTTSTFVNNNDIDNTNNNVDNPDNNTVPKSGNMFTSELDKKEEVEFLDL